MKNLSSEEMRKRELNPFFGKIISNKPLTWILKLSLIGVVILGLIDISKIEPNTSLFFASTFSFLFILVILNNIQAVWARKHGCLSLGKFLTGTLHINRIVAYFVIAFLFFGISTFVASLIYRGG
jgi:hypothetical protein